MYRLTRHPILEAKAEAKILFYFSGKKLFAQENEVISSALFANGIRIFGHHPKDGSPQGMFCANGQCAQCMVIANGVPVKGCMIPVKEGMQISPCEGIPQLPEVEALPEEFEPTETRNTDVLIIGGGPAGITAALELAQHNVKVLIVDDKHRLGGKLVLQTHSFFGTVADCYAGIRGIDIATKLASEIEKCPTVRCMLNTTAVACYSDNKIGLVKDGKYYLIHPKKLLVAAGAREKALSFPGCDLPGIYGAGAFQTLVNRDLVKPSQRLFVVGGGNVGLIAAYHAIQAGIEVVGLVEAMPKVGGYKVHQDKVLRLGIPVWTSHTVKCVIGQDKVESVTVHKVDEEFNPIPGTEKTYLADTVLIAVGLNPVNELFDQAKKFGMDVYSAGDAMEIAEASAAIFSGRIAGRRIAKALGKSISIPKEWYKRWDILKSKPGRTVPLEIKPQKSGLFPVIRCVEEIPCDPCIYVCPKDMIKMPPGAWGPEDEILGLPEVVGDECTGCNLCVAACPGLAITLVDIRKEGPDGLVTVPFELLELGVEVGDQVEAVDMDGEFVSKARVEKTTKRKAYDRTILVTLKLPRDKAVKVAGFKIQDSKIGQSVETPKSPCIDDETIVCRCERVKAKEIKELIRQGVKDMNQLKVLRCGMGACGGKTCQSLIMKLYQQEGMDLCEVIPFTQRPLVAEVDLGTLAGEKAI